MVEPAVAALSTLERSAPGLMVVVHVCENAGAQSRTNRSAKSRFIESP
jgi:hypothetical protein